MATRKPKLKQVELIDVSVIIPEALKRLAEEFDHLVEDWTDARTLVVAARPKIQALMEEHSIKEVKCKSGRIIWLDVTQTVKTKVPKDVKQLDGDSDAEAGSEE